MRCGGSGDKVFQRWRPGSGLSAAVRNGYDGPMRPRRTTKSGLRGGAGGLLLLLSLPGWAVPANTVSDADIEARYEAMGRYHEVQTGPYREEAFAVFLRDLVADLPVEGMSMTQVERVAPLFLYHPESRRRLLGRVGELEGEGDETGARAAVMRLILSTRDVEPERLAALVEAVVAHPGVPSLIRSGRGSDLFQILMVLPREIVSPAADGIAAWVDSWTGIRSPSALASGLTYRDLLTHVESSLAPDRRAGVRRRAEQAIARASAQARDEGNPTLADWLDHQRRPDASPGSAPTAEADGAMEPK